MIVAIDGVPTGELPREGPAEERARAPAAEGERGRDIVDAVKNRLRGEPGSTVTLSLRRAGATREPLTRVVPRKLVRLPDVSLAARIEGVRSQQGLLASDDVGYLRLDGFSEGTSAEVG